LRLTHFEALRPICPPCHAERGEARELMLTVEAARHGDDVIEGVLQCPGQGCLREYPILDGIPILVPDVRGYIASQLHLLQSRDDLSPVIETFLGEGSGPGSPLDVARTHLSSYAWDHYGEWDCESMDGAHPGSVARALGMGLGLAENNGVVIPEGPLLDLGCAVGRASFELAVRRSGNLVVGVDLGFQFLRVASRVLRRGSIRYPLRRGGVRYDWREFPVRFEGHERVDFWAGDAVRLPFSAGTFGGAVALNLLDCVYSPLDLLREIARVLRPGGAAIMAAPYDWTPAATPIEGWIGGHSPRSLGGGASEAVLRALLTPGAHAASVEGLEMVAERDEVPWAVRMHDRSVVTYDLHMVVVVRR